ncbi:MAG: hypothetical protein FWE95_00330 [Planctomycetaceae bacterium]|nr:hypothetical protein [Planctomycetaceae bacterium]
MPCFCDCGRRFEWYIDNPFSSGYTFSIRFADKQMRSENMSVGVSSKTIYLRHDDPSDVLVHPADDDKSVVSASDAVLAILGWGSISAEISVLNEQLRSLLGKLQQWSRKHSDRIHRSDVQVRSFRDILFVAMQKSIPYDDDLMGEMSELDIDIFNDPNFSEICLNTLVIPRCSIDSMQAFVNLDRSICVAEFKDA